MKQKLALVSVLSLLMVGCATHRSQTENIRKAFAVGNTQKAQELVDEEASDRLDGGDAVIWLLEQGAVSRANKDIKGSIKAFDMAYEKIKDYEDKAKVQLGEEAAAMLINQSYIDYKGFHYDKIMRSIYQSLNYIEMKDFERANVELKRMQQAQADAKRVNLERIEKTADALNDANASKSNIDIAGFLSSEAMSSKMSEFYDSRYKADPRTTIQQASNIYVNPFGYWLYGVSLMSTGDIDDKRMAGDAFRICAEMLGHKSSVLNSDAEDSKAVQEGSKTDMGNITYVVLETGMAPIRRQFRIDLPLWLISSNLPHVSANFPYLEKQDSFKESVSVVAGSQMVSFDTITNMDDIVEEEFYIELPTIITKTLISSAAKATAQYFAAQAAGDWALLVHIGGALLQTLANDADLRTWTTLPKSIKLAKVQTPADGKIMVDNVPVSVNTTGVNIIYVKTMSDSSPSIVRVIDFKPKTETDTQVVEDKNVSVK